LLSVLQLVQQLKKSEVVVAASAALSEIETGEAVEIHPPPAAAADAAIGRIHYHVIQEIIIG
jgi:hypothetical protein